MGQKTELDKVNPINLSRINSIEINEEYNNQLGEVLSELKEINELNNEFNSMAISQGEKINEVEKTVEDSSNHIHSSNEKLIEVSGYQKSIFWKKSFLLTTCTAVVTAPVCVFIGAKAAVIAAVGTVGYGLYNMI